MEIKSINEITTIEKQQQDLHLNNKGIKNSKNDEEIRLRKKQKKKKKKEKKKQKAKSHGKEEESDEIQNESMSEAEKSKELITLGNMVFSNRDELVTYFRTFLNLPRPTLLTPDGQYKEVYHNLVELVSRHPKKEKKIGPGIKAFEVNAHSKYSRSPCFFVVREDGTREDFSYLKCINPKLYEKKHLKRLRKEQPNKQPKEKASKSRKISDVSEINNQIYRGLILVINNLPSGTTLAELRHIFQDTSVDLIGQAAYIRFPCQEETQKALKEKIELKGKPLSTTLLTGEEEERYWKQRILTNRKKLE